ncbi:MAG: Ribosomal RNA small subunit methyltransferase H [Candidatus Azambacteria bacterium GW2011_GWF1_41_10]|nr:MAG: Ribosomal RNA small subunit methyltransferase H [Candidatus Azambacteria bacterium GW2011_GWF1_41_10]
MSQAGQRIENDLNQNMHKSVLLHESIEALDLKPGKIIVDATYGGGGHSKEVRRLFPAVEIIAIDQDPEVDAIRANFRDLDKVVTRKVDAILFDLGISTDQLEQSGRGFTFLKDEPLNMRISGEGITAADILNSWDESALELVLRGFGEESNSRRIARKIVEERKVKPFTTTFDLVKVVGKRKGKIHPATKTFQALRIAVNEELANLETGLEKGFQVLGPNGRFAVISFHSLEDRIVKNFFRKKIKEKLARQITKKPLIPNIEEIKRNPRSRSAKLRVIEKI